MPTDIKMPQLGESVTEGTVGKWLKQPGERVEKYEALLEVTTDKVDTEVPAPMSGIVREIVVPEGTTVRVGTLLAVLDDEGGRTESQESRTDENETQNSELRTQNSFISPVVARLVAEHNLDLGKISGSGQGGRVTKQDVLEYVELHKGQPSRMPTGARPSDEGTSAPTAMPSAQSAEPAASVPSASQSAQSAEPAASVPSASQSAQSAEPTTSVPSASQSVRSAEPELPDDAEIIPLSSMRRSIAEHMVRSRRTAPHVTTVFEVDVSQIVAHRERRKADFERQGVKLTYTPYFVQAAVAGLQAVPVVNASYAEAGIVVHQRIHVGVAVALEDGLIVPVIRDADEKNLLGLARAVNDLSARARTRRSLSLPIPQL